MPPAELLGWLQLAAILIGIVAVFINIGRKDATLAANARSIEELRSIAADLVKGQLANAIHIEELRRRLDQLERNR